MTDHYLLPVGRGEGGKGGRGEGGKKWNGVEGFCLCYDSSIRLCNTLMILYPPPQMMAVNWQSILATTTDPPQSSISHPTPPLPR